MVLFRLARTVAFPPPSYSNIFAAYCGPCAFTFALKSIPVGILMVLFTLLGNSCFIKRTSCKLPRKARFADRFSGFCNPDIRPSTFKTMCFGMRKHSFCRVKMWVLPRKNPVMFMRSAGMECRNLDGTLPYSSGCKSLRVVKPFNDTASCPGLYALKAFKAIVMLAFSSVLGKRR